MVPWRRWFLPIVTVISLLLVGGGWVIGARLSSPELEASRASAPDPARLTAVVRRQVLKESAVLRGQVVAAHTVEVPSFTPDGATSPIVTAVSKSKGEGAAEGDVLAAVAGRPLIALTGEVPMYRGLDPGSTPGPDVTQLQAALRRLGFGIADSEGVYGPSTRQAVADMYARRGYAAAGSSSGDNRARSVRVPPGEIVFVPQLPAIIEDMGIQVGQDISEVEGTLMTLAAGAKRVEARVDPLGRSAIRQGAGVSIRVDSEGKYRGTVTSISEATNPDPTEGRGFTVVIDFAQPFDGASGATVLVDASRPVTNRPVLTVPIAAVTTSSDGTKRLVKLVGDDRTESVKVRVGKIASGFAEVMPVDGEIEEGDAVLLAG